MKVTPAAVQAVVNGDMENFLAASTPGGIEAQEAAGQKSFVANQTLPKECPREDLEKLGFVFGEEADDIFIKVQFPEGWEKVPTDHSMWNDLVDDKGRKRGSIFYKAAFYDRSAQMRLSPRFSIQKNYKLKNDIQFFVLDGDTVVYETDLIKLGEYSKENQSEHWKAEDCLRADAVLWLAKNYPDSKNVSAYWD